MIPNFILDGKVYESAEEIIALFNKQDNWLQSHTDLILRMLEVLCPGQSVTFKRDTFVVIGHNDEGCWEQQLKHPQIIYKADEKLLEMVSSIVDTKIKLSNVDDLINQFSLNRSKIKIQLSCFESMMLNYSKRKF